MTPDPVCVGPDTSLTGTAQQMRHHAIDAVPVVVDGPLLGMVTDRDLVVHGLADDHDAVTVVGGRVRALAGRPSAEHIIGTGASTPAAPRDRAVAGER